MYEFLLTHKLLTGLIGLLLSVTVGAALGGRGLGLRSMAYGFGPMLALAFYVALLFADSPPNLVDLLSVITFELVVFVMYLMLLRRLLACVREIPVDEVNRSLKISVVLQIVFAVPIVASGGFGIFSEGARIEYIYAGSLPKYFTYAGLMVATTQAALLASRITHTGGIGWPGALALLMNLGLSVAAGSKGAFLWMFSVAALVDYRRARIPKTLQLLVAVGGAGALVVSSIIIADFIGITTEQFTDLALSRFFLNNDARSLAFDLRSQVTAETGLLSESFRSLGNLFGSPPRNDPLGVLLYAQRLGVTNGSGANASLMALVTFYSTPGYATIPALFGSLAVGAGMALLPLRPGHASSRQPRCSPHPGSHRRGDVLPGFSRLPGGDAPRHRHHRRDGDA